MSVDTELETKHPKPPSLADAVIPLVAMVVFIGGSLILFGLDALDGPIQVALIASCLVAALIALKNGFKWGDVQAAGQSAMGSITSAVFILLSVGALIGTWNMSGTIPTLVYYGIQVLSPTWFYAATALICGIVAMSIGSSWTTAGTIGVGLMGIGLMLGVNPAIAAGAVISGAYLGDKLSPLSETTILTAQMVKVDVMTHVRAQAWTSLPAFGIAMIIFLILGFTSGGDVVAPAPQEVELEELSNVFNITAWNLLPLLLLVVMSVRKVPASMALFVSAVFAGFVGAFTQAPKMAAFIGVESLNIISAIKATWLSMAVGFNAETGLADIDRLVSRGGMDSMLFTLWLIIGAVTFGALMDELGLIGRLTAPLLEHAKSQGQLFLAVFATGFGLNIIAGDQYIALVLPARTYRAEFARRGLAPTNLSRLAADSGTVTSPLIPWNSCGAFMSSTLGVSTLLYAPFALFNIFSPLLDIGYGFTGFKIEKTEPEELEGPTTAQEIDDEDLPIDPPVVGIP